MADNKRYYWLRLQDDFFQSKRIKKLRSLAGGDTFTIIYLKMQLLSISKGGCLEYTGLEDSFAKELALDLDEKPDNVEITVSYLLNVGLLETSDNCEYKLPFVIQNIGSETASTQRSRDCRERQRLLQCNNNATQLQQPCNVEIEKEKDIDIKEKNKEKKRDRFTPPTLEEVKAYCEERKNGIDAQHFLDFYATRGWKTNSGIQIRDWKACVRTWEHKDFESDKTKTKRESSFNLEDFFEAATKRGDNE